MAAPVAGPARTEQLRAAVCRAYSAAAERPADKHAFPVGRAFAESLGYPAELLSTLPAVAVEAFAGVSDVAVFAMIPAGAVVLDLGCGAGVDTLVAAQRTGPRGLVVGIDFSAAMLARAQAGTAALGARAAFIRAGGERLPLRDRAIDVVLVNGIFNLNPARTAIFSELARVVRRGGAVYAAELVLVEPVPRAEFTSEADWFA